MKKNIWVSGIISLFVIALLFTAGCGGGNGQNSDSANGDQGRQSGDRRGERGGPGNGPPDGAPPEGVPVRVATIGRGMISDSILSTSVVEAEQSVDIYARVTGAVTDIAAEESQAVKKGDLLCALEDEELALQESKTRAEMAKLKQDLERIQTLLKQGISTETDVANARYNYDQAEIEWRKAKANLDFTQIKAPIDGVVFERLVRLGQKVTPSDQLYSLFDPKSLVVNVFIPESDYFADVANRIKSVDAVISSDSLPGREFPGSIKRVAPVIDPQTNTIKLTLEYRDPGRVLRPGMYVRVRLITDRRENAVLIPKAALLFDENRRYVFIIRDGAAQRINLELGYEDTLFVESLSQIEDGDQVVVVGQNGLKTGSKVRIVSGETGESQQPEPADAETSEPVSADNGENPRE